MKEHGTLFTSEMVRAILSDRKTQTRRLITRRNCDHIPGYLWDRLEFDDAKVPEGAMRTFADDGFGDGGYLHVACRPHPKAPRRLQTPEDWTLERVYPRVSVGDVLWVKETWKPLGNPAERVCAVDYRATGWDVAGTIKWRPSIFMPRWASRIDLEVTAIRGQRVQDISEGDAIAEGVGCVEEYADLWDSINGRKAPRESNPWVWTYTFRRIRP